MSRSFLTEESKRELVKAAGLSAKRFKKDINKVLIQLRQHELMGQALMNSFYKGYHQALINLDGLIKKGNLPVKLKEKKNVGVDKQESGQPSPDSQLSNSIILPSEGSTESQSPIEGQGGSTPKQE